ncbi:MAG: glycerate kinase [Muribaculaceae bacterium]|nr:glycerate kinase [Muribaculaceae bacterium]
MPTKIIIASDSFKGSLSGREVGEAAARGIQAADSEKDVEIIPVADGGEGTVEAIVSGLGGEIVSATVCGPLGDPVIAQYGLCGDTAVIEMASASSLTLIPKEKRNPWITSSYGTGQLIYDALKRGYRNFLIGIGGSATNDAGTGMLSALGFRFLDCEGETVGRGGGETGRISSIDFSNVMPELKEARFTIACDVCNPLTGPEGSSMVFGPQKGANKDMVAGLDENLSSFARICAQIFHKDYSSVPGAGAAGGLGFAFLSFLGGKLQPGIDMVLDAVGFDNRIDGASLIITGEGKIDRQTCMGKAPYGVLQRGKAKGIPVVAIGGSVEKYVETALMDAGFRAVYPITTHSIPLEEAMRPEVATSNIERTVRRIIEKTARND